MSASSPDACYNRVSGSGYRETSISVPDVGYLG